MKTILSVLLLGAVSGAQVTIRSVTTLETTGCFVRVENPQFGYTSSSDELPAGRVLASGQQFAAGVGSGQCAASGSLRLSWSGARLDVDAAFALDARSCWSALSHNRGRVLVEFAAPRPTAGYFDFPISRQVTMSLQPGLWSQVVYPSRQHPLVITDGFVLGVEFSLNGEVDINSLLRFGARTDSAAMRFVEVPTSIETYLPACGPALEGGLLTTNNPFYRAEFEVRGSPVTPFTFFVIGNTQLAIPIPPTFCEVGTEFLIVVPRPVDANGRARLSFVVASSLLTTPVNLQFLAATLEGPVQLWRSSNVLRMLPR